MSRGSGRTPRQERVRNKYAERDYYFKLLTDPKNSSIQQYATAEEAIKLADKAGVEKIVMQGWYWNDP